jgi:crotonobetainyl-CoA:carnitine CoA-transferase CaiB-like acyl-CoA transferase
MVRRAATPEWALAGVTRRANAQRGDATPAVPHSAGAPAGILTHAALHRVAGSGPAPDYAAALITSLGGRVERTPGPRAPSAAIAWARSGAMALTGAADGPPRLARLPLASCADGAAGAVALLAGNRWTGGHVDGAALLGERAAIAGFRRRGAISPGGACRMLRAADGWIALNLARPDDVALLPAWLGDGVANEPWGFAAERAALRPTEELIARARLLGLPAAAVSTPRSSPPPWLRVAARGAAVARDDGDAPLAVDLSSLWAGPLCSQLIGRAGVRVVKVESARRPDGGRFGPAAFFDLLNAGKASVSIDFSCKRGREQLRRLVASADIVVESSRPRALAQLGIDAAELVASTPGLTWVSITGYGRREPYAGWVAFGDDAGVAAGLAVASASPDGPPEFCGDAIADPLTGLHAAAAALASWRGGGGHLLDLALCDVAAHVAAVATADYGACVRAAGESFEVVEGDVCASVAQPRARSAAAAARPLGADTAAVLNELGIPC